MATANDTSPVIIKKVKKKSAHAHHGGAWKVAYADFVTAMMAFFLLLWLLNATTKDQKRGISEYFSPTTASNTTGGAGGLLGGAAISSPGAMTSRTAQPSVSLELRPTSGAQDGDARTEGGGEVKQDKPNKTSDLTNDQLKKELAKRQKEQFDKAEAAIRQAIKSTPDLKNLDKNLVMDQTPKGLRIQIIDRKGKPMFPNGSAQMFERTRKLLAKITPIIAKLPNKISVTGHTDSTPYRGNRKGYGNWELSADRALESRRVLIQSGLNMKRIALVTGKADTDPLIKNNPKDPRNRRISIVLLSDVPHPNGAGKTKGSAAPAKQTVPVDANGDPLFKRDWTGPRLK